MTDAAPSKRIYLDTNIFIGAYETNDATSKRLRSYFERFEAFPKLAVTSELTLAELVVHDLISRRFYMNLIIWKKFIDLIPVSRTILIETARYRSFLMRSHKKMKLPDAIHCVTAINAKCDLVFSADQRLTIPNDMRRIGPNPEGFSMIDEVLDA